MTRVVLDGLSHLHVGYFLKEFEARPDDIELAGVHLYEDAERALLPDWFTGAVCGSVDELLDRCRPGALISCGIYDERAGAVTAALDAGVPVLADKPMAVSEEGLAAISRAASAPGRVVSIAFEKRWYPVTMVARRLVDEGAIGRVRLVAATGPHKLIPDQRPDWFFSDRYGPALTDIPIHDVDLALLFSGVSGGRVNGWQARPRVRPEVGRPWVDSCGLLLDGDGGEAMATIEAHWLWPSVSPYHGRYRMRLTGELGTMEVDWATGELDVVSDGPLPDWFQPGPVQGPGKRPAEDFFDALLAGRRPEVTNEDSLTATAIVLAAARSAANDGAPVQWSRLAPGGQSGERA